MEQAGIYRIDLFENKGLGLRFVDASNSQYAISVIGTEGKLFEFNFCNFVRVNQEPTINSNNNNAFNYSIEFSLLDLAAESRFNFSQLKNRYGYYALLYFKNGAKLFINAPLFVNAYEQNLSIANQRIITLTNEQPTEYDFFDIKTVDVLFSDYELPLLVDNNTYLLIN